MKKRKVVLTLVIERIVTQEEENHLWDLKMDDDYASMDEFMDFLKPTHSTMLSGNAD